MAKTTGTRHKVNVQGGHISRDPGVQGSRLQESVHLAADKMRDVKIPGIKCKGLRVVETTWWRPHGGDHMECLVESQK